MELVLSLFPGADFLGRGFEAEGFAVARGPDLLWDQRVEDYSVPPGRFDGVIGGPPCQHYSDANRNRDSAEGDRLVLEFLRLVSEAQPAWFVMENVRNVPTVAIDGYHVQRIDVMDSDFGGQQRRLRHIQFGSKSGDIIRPLRTNTHRPVTPKTKAVLCRADSEHERHSRRLTRQGYPYLPLKSLTRSARLRVVGNGVPWAVSTALAQAVTSRGPVTDTDCHCLCGRPISGKQTYATAACRKRMERIRKQQIRTLTFSRS